MPGHKAEDCAGQPQYLARVAAADRLQRRLHRLHAGWWQAGKAVLIGILGGTRRWLRHCGADVGGASDDKRQGRRCFRSRRTVPSPNNGSACNRLHSKIAHRVTIRSEEHTSELQSLMRISYAVFCLKKKKYIQTKPL